MPIDNYRRFQAAIPGVDGLYGSMRAILDSVLPDRASILIVGAGGGREIEALAASPRDYKLLGVDPSADMLALARSYAGTPGSAQETKLFRGVVDDLPHELHDAATSILVMHFLPDDGGKAKYLDAIRKRLRTGATYLHVDVSVDSREAFERWARAFSIHAELAGLPSEVAAGAPSRIAEMPIVSEEITLERFAQAGFKLVSPFFRALWYVGWWARAA